MIQNIAYRSGKAVGYLARAGVLTPDIIAILAILFFFLVPNAGIVTLHIDELAGKISPLVGWVLFGFILGCLLSVTVRVRDFGWFGSKSLVLSIPNIERLRAGQNAVRRVRQWKFVLGLIGLSVIIMFVGLSWRANSRFPNTSDAEELIDRVREAGKTHDIRLINRTLSDTANKLGHNETIPSVSDFSSALKILVLIQSFEKDVYGPVKRAGEAASRHIALYRNVTAEMVKSGLPGALNRAFALLEVDRRSAAFWIGQLYELGKGGAKQDLLKAFASYDDAARLGNDASSEALERLAKRGIDDSNSDARKASFSYFDAKAKKGDPWAQYWLGKWYEKNQDDGISRNKSVELLVKVASQDGNKPSQIAAFVDLCRIGVGHQSAQPLLDKLAPVFATGDNRDAKFAAYTYLEARAKKGDPWAQYWLGKWYEKNQDDGISRNKSVELLVKVASQDSNKPAQIAAFVDLCRIGVGHQSAQPLLDKLAPVFATGNNVDAKLAAYTYLEARAKKGDPGAQLWTGYRYREGDGTSKDLSKARSWFGKAATQDRNETIRERAYAALLNLPEGNR